MSERDLVSDVSSYPLVDQPTLLSTILDEESTALTLDELKLELDKVIKEEEEELENQKREIQDLSRAQIDLQEELKEEDQIEKSLTSEYDQLKKHLNARKKREAELSKMEVELKEMYQKAIRENDLRRADYMHLDYERNRTLTRKKKLEDDIVSLQNRREDAIKTQHEKEVEFEEKCKLIDMTREQYEAELVALCEETGKWEEIHEIVMREIDIETEEIMKKVEIMERKRLEAEENANEARNQYIELLNKRDDEIGALSFNALYDEFYSMVKEIHTIERKINMKRMIEDRLVQEISDMLERNKTFIEKKRIEEDEEIKESANRNSHSDDPESPRSTPRSPRSPRPSTPRVEINAKLLQKMRKRIYGTVEEFMLKKTKAEYDVVAEMSHFTNLIAQRISESIPDEERQYIHKLEKQNVEISRTHFRSEVANSEEMIRLVELAHLRRIGSFNNKALSNLAEHLARAAQIDIEPILPDLELGEEIYDDYYVDYDEELTKLSEQRLALESELKQLEQELGINPEIQKPNIPAREATRTDLSSLIDSTQQHRDSSRLFIAREELKDIIPDVVNEQRSFDEEELHLRWYHAKQYAIKGLCSQLNEESFISPETRSRSLINSLNATHFQCVTEQ